MTKDWTRQERFLKALETEIFHQPETTVDRKVIDAYLPKFIEPIAGENRDLHILDVGCGYGYAMEKFKEMGFESVQGFTIHREDYDACKLKELTVHLMDVNFNEAMSGFFNVVWCRNMLQYSPYPFFTLLELNRLMRLGGWVYIEVPEYGRQHAYYNTLPVDSYAMYLQRAGFEVIQRDSFELSADGVSEKYNFLVANKKFNVKLPELDVEE
jgi:2-polyprenyl-3-methyl-5-hydroxy-6-metoxy-1,4-benzoquinol methylase